MSITADGKTVFFSSNRNGKEGRFDLFKSTLNAKGQWGEVYRLSTIINTGFDEVTPYITPDGSTLFYASNFSASTGLGGFDIYYTELKNGNWTPSQNMGSPINAGSNDASYFAAAQDHRVFMRINETGNYDIYTVDGGDFDFETVFGNTNKEKLRDIWFGEKRQNAIKEAYSNMCTKCSAAIWGN